MTIFKCKSNFMRLVKSFDYVNAVDYKLHSNSLMMSNFYFRGKTHERRYRFLVAFGYTFPTVISLFTLLAEFVAPECASYKPRFGEEGCFFAG